MSYRPARAEQIVFLGNLMRVAGFASDEEVSEYQANIIRLAADEDPYASEERVAWLIDYNLDQYANHAA